MLTTNFRSVDAAISLITFFCMELRNANTKELRERFNNHPYILPQIFYNTTTERYSTPSGL